jgi:hypothetical protein
MPRSLRLDLAIFISELGRDWVFWMGGVLGVLWTIATLAKPGAAVWLYESLCFIALLFACFRVWRRAYKEARPYVEETFQSVKKRFDSLQDEERFWLKDLLISKRDRHCGQLVRPQMMGFVSFDISNRLAFVNPEFAPILARLFTERDAALGHPPLEN